MRKILFIVGGVSLFLTIGLITLLILTKPEEYEEYQEETAEEITEKRTPKKEKTIFVEGGGFTINLINEENEYPKYLRVEFSFELKESMKSDWDKFAKTSEPRVANDFILVLTSKKAKEILHREGKEHLAQELKEKLNRRLAELQGPDKKLEVESVLFTLFLIQ